MEEIVRQALQIGRAMWKYRWQGVIAAWVVGAIAVVVALRVPERYEASARIFVDTQTILKPLMSGLAVQPNIDQQVVMLSRTLISRPNVEKLVRMADLDLKDGSALRHEERIELLMRELRIQSVGRDNLYTLSYQDSDPDRAKRVVQSLVSIFVESSLGASRKDSDSAKVFINDQIKSYQAKLEEAEARLKDFRLQNIEYQSSDGRDSASRMADLALQLDQAKLELREAETARDAAKLALDAERQQDRGRALPDLLASSSSTPQTPEIDARIAAQERSLDGLLQRFTEAHPDIVSGRRLIADLQDQRQKQIAEKQRAAASSPLASSTSNGLAFQELSRMLATADVQVATLRTRVEEYAARYAAARGRLKVAPQIEAEAARLNRDYAIHKKNYEDLVARRESAAMSGSLESVSGLADFRLIDPPRVSPNPVAPNRLLLLALAMAIAISAGLAFAFVASQLRPVFHGAADLRLKFNLPLLGVVALVRTPDERKRERRDLLRFGAASGGLVGLFVAGIATLAILRGI